MKMDWIYLTMKPDGNGEYVLVDDEGYLANQNWPSFKNRDEAEAYLNNNNIRAWITNT